MNFIWNPEVNISLKDIDKIRESDMTHGVHENLTLALLFNIKDIKHYYDEHKMIKGYFFSLF